MSADNQQGRLCRYMERTRLHPHYIAGFVDGEGSFHIAITKDRFMKVGMKFIPEFHVSQRVSSKEVLDALCTYFGCGYVRANHATNPRDRTYVFVVRNRDDLLTKILPFFERYRLHTEKQNDFSRFAEIVRRMERGEHRDLKRARKILALAYQMNQGGKYRHQIHTL